jgi:hypothetical protein
MSHHFLLPRGRLPDDIPLCLPSKHSVTATSFNSSSRRSPATSLSASPPFPYHPSRAAMDGSCWRASYHTDPIAGSPHLCGPPGLLSAGMAGAVGLPPWGRAPLHWLGLMADGPAAEGAQENSGMETSCIMVSPYKNTLLPLRMD